MNRDETYDMKNGKGKECLEYCSLSAPPSDILSDPQKLSVPYYDYYIIFENNKSCVHSSFDEEERGKMKGWRNFTQIKYLLVNWAGKLETMKQGEIVLLFSGVSNPDQLSKLFGYYEAEGVIVM